MSLDRLGTSNRRPRVRRLLAALCGVMCASLLTVPSAGAHFAGFTGGTTFNCSIPYAADCYWQPNNAVYHSYGFVSGNTSQSKYICPSIWAGGVRRSICGYGFERNCYYLWKHSSSHLDCHDQDGPSFLASVYYGGPYAAGATASTTIHPTW